MPRRVERSVAAGPELLTGARGQILSATPYCRLPPKYRSREGETQNSRKGTNDRDLRGRADPACAKLDPRGTEPRWLDLVHAHGVDLEVLVPFPKVAQVRRFLFDLYSGPTSST